MKPRILHLFQSAASVAVAIAAFALCGSAGGLQLSLSLPVAAAIAIAIHRHLLHGSRAGEWVLSITAMVMALGITLNTNNFTTVHNRTHDAPVLRNTDTLRYLTYAE